jgi:hypothetical protein
MTEYIYLLQLLRKRDVIKTKEYIYKIGKTKQENIKRIGNYENDSILVCQIKCNDCDKLEKVLITLFEEKYELQKDIGNEYFKGNCDDMRDDIYNYINDEDKEEDVNEDVNDEEEDEIKNKFPTYKDDESFGGTKKLIKFSFVNNRIYTYYINDEKEIVETFIQRNWFQKDCYDNSDYITKLLENNVIQDGLIYDFNDIGFVKKLNKHKIKLDITYTEENFVDIISKFNTLEQNICFKIENILYNNCILNKKIYCDYINNTLYIDFIIPYNNSLQKYEIDKRIIKINIMVIEFNTIKYDYLFLRKYTPYMIEINDNEYYLYNRDYQIIDKNEKIYSIENWKGKRIYLYNDDTNPIRSSNTKKEMVKMLNDMKSKYNSITLNMKCMNMNENTNMILNL